MKIKMIFNMENEGDRYDCKHAQKGYIYFNILDDLDQWLRSKLKYEELPKKDHKIFDLVRTQLHELLNDEGIDLHE